MLQKLNIPQGKAERNTRNLTQCFTITVVIVIVVVLLMIFSITEKLLIYICNEISLNYQNKS